MTEANKPENREVRILHLTPVDTKVLETLIRFSGYSVGFAQPSQVQELVRAAIYDNRPVDVIVSSEFPQGLEAMVKNPDAPSVVLLQTTPAFSDPLSREDMPLVYQATHADLPTVLGYAVRDSRQRRSKILAELTDKKTDLLNYSGMNERGADLVARATRQGDPLAVYAFDIDDFKRINDTEGHPFGDVVICSLADILKTVFRRHGFEYPARTGGEEFVGASLSESTMTAGEALDVYRMKGESVIEAVSALKFPGKDTRVTVSGGGLVYVPPKAKGRGGYDMPAFQELVARSDQLLYVAKGNGKDQLAFEMLPKP